MLLYDTIGGRGAKRDQIWTKMANLDDFGDLSDLEEEDEEDDCLTMKIAKNRYDIYG